MQREVRRSILSGRMRAPPSVAVAHRAIIAASFAEGQSVISNVPASESLAATADACNSLGADVQFGSGIADVIGGGEIRMPGELSCGASNTTLKLFMGIFSHFPQEVLLTGSGALLERNIRPFTQYLDSVSAYTLNPSGSLPLHLRGPIKSGELAYFPPLGTQFLSGLLLGAPISLEDTEIGIAGGFAERGCLDATVGIMKKAGVQFAAEEADFFAVPGGQGYLPLREFDVPASRTLSSYLLLAGALAGKCVLEGLPEMPPLGAVFSHFGAFSSYSEGSFTSGAGTLEAADFDVSHSAGFIPHALVLACLSAGESRLIGFPRIRRSQRARVRRLASQLKRMGADIREIPEGLLVAGGKLHGAEVEPGDARVAMACAAAALCAEGPTTINGAECLDGAYPGFFRDLAQLGAIVR